MYSSPEFLTLKEGIKIAYYRFGSPNGIPLILIHGYMSRAKSYAGIIPLLEKKYNILAIDQRGHGLSDKPQGSIPTETLALYTLDLFADNIKEIVEKLHFPTPFVIFGHSMGGMITQLFVLKYPVLVSHVVLASTLSNYKTENMRASLQKYKSGEMKIDEANFRMLDSMNSNVKWRKLHPEHVEENIRYKLTIPPAIYIACLENVVENFDVRDQLKNISQPTLVITGDRDGMVMYSNSEFIAQQIPNSRLVIIPKLSHNILHEASETVVEALDHLIRG